MLISDAAAEDATSKTIPTPTVIVTKRTERTIAGGFKIYFCGRPSKLAISCSRLS
jgi:hypothetical protein